MKCVVCGRRKGKRFCPAKNASICAQCCGEKRVVQIDCPEDCQYLSSGLGYQLNKRIRGQIDQELGLDEKLRLFRVKRDFWLFLSRLEEVIIRYSWGLRSLDDLDVRSALELLVENYRTESKGIIYEHQSSNPLAQSLARELGDAIESLRFESEDSPSLSTQDILDCLTALVSDVNFNLSSRGEAYLTFITRNHPDLKRDSGDNLIVT